MCKECACPEKYDDRNYVTAESKFSTKVAQADRPTIADQLQGIAGAIEVLHESISALEKKLGPVTREADDTPAIASPEPSGSVVGYSVWAQAMRVRAAAERIGRLYQNVDLP